MLHGFLGLPEEFRELLRHWQPPYPAIPIPLPGHGPSPTLPSPLNFDTACAYLIDQITQKSAAPVILYGYSMGGRLAWELAIRYPNHIQELIIESANPGIKTDPIRKIRLEKDTAWAQKLRERPLSEFLEDWYSQPLFAPFRTTPTFQTRLSEQHRHHTAALADTLTALSPSRQANRWPEIARLKTPTTYLSGDLDTAYTGIGQRLAKKNPAIRHIQIPGAGHVPHLEAPETVAHCLKLSLGN